MQTIYTLSPLIISIITSLSSSSLAIILLTTWELTICHHIHILICNLKNIIYFFYVYVRYTAGRAGFTSGTCDLEQVVNLYCQMKPNNVLCKYQPALKNLCAKGGDSVAGLDAPFMKDWRTACNEAQIFIMYIYKKYSSMHKLIWLYLFILFYLIHRQGSCQHCCSR